MMGVHGVWKLLFLSMLLVFSYWNNFTDAQCTQGDVRLTSKSYSGQYVYGLVEICSLGQWGKICGYSRWYSYNNYGGHFGYNEARVICRQLGYSDRGARPTSNNYARYLTFLLTRGLDCIGNETSWLDCDLQPSYSTCSQGSYSYYYAASVQCILAPTLQVSITTIPHLANGIVQAGTSLAMTCTVLPYATGIETYQWDSDCTGDCFIHGSVPTIYRNVLRVDDSGHHMCTVTRGNSSESASITLNVIEPNISTTISLPFVGLDSPPYEHFTLWCNATASSTQLTLPLIMTWFKDGTKIDTDSESESMIVQTPQCSVQNCSVLIVNDAVVSFSGEYMCVASIEIPGYHMISNAAKTNVTIHATTEAIIQLHMTGVHHCKDWVFIEAHEKAADISELLTQAIEERCDCDFTLERLEDSGLVCTLEDLNEIVYQTRILAVPEANSDTLVNIITQIVNEEGQTFVVRGLRLMLVPNCPIETDSFVDMKCRVNDTTVTVVPMTPKAKVSVAIAITEGIAIFMIVVIAISSCLVCVWFFRRYKKTGRFLRMMDDHSDVSFGRESGVNISGGLHFRPTASRAESDIYEELPLKTDQDDI